MPTESEIQGGKRDYTAAGLYVAGTVFGVAWLVVVAMSIYTWLRTGQWPAIPIGLLALLLPLPGSIAQWLVEPDSWLGVHKIVTGVMSLPMATTLGFLAVGFFYLASKRGEAGDLQQWGGSRPSA